MGKPKIPLDEDLLNDLDEITNIVVGNESPTDVGYGEITTLPEAIAYLMSHPTSPQATRSATTQMRKLITKVNDLNKKIQLLGYKITLKKH